MTDDIPPGGGSAHSRTSVALTRTSFFKFVGLLLGVFVLASYLLIYLANDLDHTEEREGAFYTGKAVHSLEASLRTTVRDYAFWGDAYRYLHQKVDLDWAFVRQNVGPSLYEDFGLQGLFVLDDRDQTVYSVIMGQLQPTPAASWLGPSLALVLSQARAGADSQTPFTTFIDFQGQPAVVAAAAITPGTDPTVQPDGRQPSVLIFVHVLDDTSLGALGKRYGVEGLRVASAAERQDKGVLALGENGAGGYLHWQPEQPGRRLLGLGFPLIGFTALLVCLLCWAFWRRTATDAHALDSTHLSLQRSQEALAVSEARFRDIVEISSDWIWEIDGQCRFTYLSERFEAVTGWPRDAWMGASIDSRMFPDHGTLSQWLNAATHRVQDSILCHYTGSNGQEHVTRVSARKMHLHGFRGTATDITQELEARRQIQFLSQHDPLTGLANRMRLQEFLDGKLNGPELSEKPLVMFCVGLDRFKPINDLLGHTAGDQVLHAVSKRLAECVRTGDLIARTGGDEFVLTLSQLGSSDNIEALCQRLLKSIQRPIEIDGQPIHVSASIGIAMAPDDAADANELLRYADIALHEAKAGGRNTWRFYCGEMNNKLIDRRRLETDLRLAIEHDELRLHYQPRYRLADGQMVGAEALVRWQHPQRGLIPPDTFIPIAEQTGLIIPLSNWVISTACRHAMHWPEHLYLSINLSPAEFEDGTLAGRIGDALAASAIRPSRVELEITESVMFEDAEGALAQMLTLKALGVRLAMDDFGTGFSSLSYLRTFPFDGLKIDRSFLHRLESGQQDKAIVLAIVDMGRTLSLTVTAEGIETAEQLETLKATSCDEGQGYLLSRPLDSDAFMALVGERE